MRLLTTFENEEQGRHFSLFLSKQGIANECEPVLNTNWGSEGYGSPMARIWVVDEDHFADAGRWYALFQQAPDSPQFNIDIVPSHQTEPSNKETLYHHGQIKALSQVTIFFISACIVLFVIGKLTTPTQNTLPSYLPSTIMESPITKQFLYDYPKTFVLADQLVSSYGIEKLSSPDTLPAEGKTLLMEYIQTPYWNGLYSQALNSWLQPEKGWSLNAPLFEKIKEGEWWRVFTPCLLHSDIFHILFNMIWLLVLGKQMEYRLGPRRFVLFIGLTGILSNTAQYFMSGSNFIGFSGILCAMLAFIWVREKRSPWEGYSIQKSTMSLMVIFVLAVLAIQIASFFSEIFFHTSFSPGIANTAHLTGAFVGYILGYTHLFRSNIQ